MFSFEPRHHGERGSQKYTRTPVSPTMSAIGTDWAALTSASCAVRSPDSAQHVHHVYVPVEADRGVADPHVQDRVRRCVHLRRAGRTDPDHAPGTPDHPGPPGRTPRLRGDSLIEPCRGRRCRCHIRTRHSIVTSTHDEHGRHLTDPVASSGHEADLSTEGGLREVLGRFEGAYQDLYWDLHRFR